MRVRIGFFAFVLSGWLFSWAAMPMAYAQTQGQSSQPTAQTPAQPPATPPTAITAAPQAPAKAETVSKPQPKSLEQAIEQGKSEGFLKADAAPGYLGIPGAPSPSVVLAFFWAVWVGWIFSTVGAFGGIMAGVGHLTVFGLGDYARTFKKSSPFINKLITDSIRVSNQYLVGLSAAISTLNYYKLGRIVLPLGIALGLGSVVGATAIPWLTAGKIQLSQYQGYFGLIVLVLGGF